MKDQRKKIAVVTGSRAEYGLLYWLLSELKADPAFELQLLVTGAHLSPEFGLTIKQITDDGFPVARRVEMLLSSDTDVGIVKSMGVGMIGFADALDQLRPDLMVVLGDRYEILAVVSAALVMRIPVAHLHGGELTEGAFDESIRHAITKMSHLHFAAAEPYKNRIIQLGEDPANVHNVGALGLDNIRRLELLGRDQLEKDLAFKFGSRNILVTYHPATLDEQDSRTHFASLLEVLAERKDLHIVFTRPNSDTGNAGLNALIEDFVRKFPERSKAFASLGHLRYLSVMRTVDAVVGNSSSGLIEAPSMKVGTINIGDRQKGRLMASSVIQCGTTAAEIRAAFDTLYSEKFQSNLPGTVNPNGDGGAALKIVNVLRSMDPATLRKKVFFDQGVGSVR